MITTFQRINDGTQFTGVAYAAGTAGGLHLFTGIPTLEAKLKMEYALYEISLDVQATLANAAPSLVSAAFDWVATTMGTLKWDTQVTGPTSGTSETTLTGVTSTHTATIDFIQDDGTDGSIMLRNASGIFQNNEAITGDLIFDAAADGTLDQVTIPLKTTSSLNYRFSWPNGLPVGWQDDTNKTPMALSLATTTMVGNGFWTIKWGKRPIRS